MKKVLFLLLIIITIAGCVEKTDDLEKNAGLKTLTLSTSGSSVLLSPIFSSEITEYTAVLENEKDSLTVAAETSSAKASLEGIGNIMLSVGENNIKITVTAENKSIKKEYNIKAMRKQKILDTNSELKLFAIVATGTSIVLTPNFIAGVTTYSAIVDNEVSQIILKAEPSSTFATVTGTGNKHLTVGDNNLSVVVTAEDNSKKEYTVKITRLDIGNSLKILSPDKNTVTEVFTENGALKYKIGYKGKDIIKPSSMGFHFETQLPLGENLKISDCAKTSFSEKWKPVWGQRSEIENNYNELKVMLTETTDAKRKLNVIFRVFNDGVGFRYEIPEQSGFDDFKITSEDTEFAMGDDYFSWSIRNNWDNNEKLYTAGNISAIIDAETPVTMRTGDNVYLSIHEAAIYNYAGMALKPSSTKKNTFYSVLCPWPDNKIAVKDVPLPLVTPWRTLQIGESPAALVESSLILNLNEPCKIADTSWIKPMKYVGIWWELHLGISNWAGTKHGATTENAKKYIDFASKYGFTGLLAEGWNKNWAGGNYINPTDDFNLTEILKYGKERGVDFIAHNETGGLVDKYNNEMTQIYSAYNSLGIHSIKSGYVANNGMETPKGQHHNGQWMINHYNKAVIEGAKYQLMIDTHEPIKDSGISRTYPNWLAREGARGQEYNAWDLTGNTPEHTTILPFTRLLSGPMDYTPGIFNVINMKNDKRFRVRSTRSKEMALYVIIYSPFQMVTDLPQNYLDKNGIMLPEFQFIVDVPCDWDETKVVNADIGDYVTIARKQKGKDEWFVGSITDENPRDVSVPLKFLQGTNYVAEMYSDSSETDYDTNPGAVMINKYIVTAGDTLKASLKKSGGLAVRIRPATGKDLTDYPRYK